MTYTSFFSIICSSAFSSAHIYHKLLSFVVTFSPWLFKITLLLKRICYLLHLFALLIHSPCYNNCKQTKFGVIFQVLFSMSVLYFLCELIICKKNRLMKSGSKPIDAVVFLDSHRSLFFHHFLMDLIERVRERKKAWLWDKTSEFYNVSYAVLQSDM